MGDRIKLTSSPDPAAMARLNRHAGRHARLVELCYFGGFAIEEAADTLAILPATAKRDWTLARAWLYHRIRSG